MCQVEIPSFNCATLTTDAGATKFRLAAEAVACRLLYELLLCNELGRNTSLSLSPPPVPLYQQNRPPIRSTTAMGPQHVSSRSVQAPKSNNSIADLEVPTDGETDIADSGISSEDVCLTGPQSPRTITDILHSSSRSGTLSVSTVIVQCFLSSVSPFCCSNQPRTHCSAV